MPKRGVIHDNNAYLRFKRFIREAISEEQSVDFWHSVGKSPWRDDTIVIHGQEWQPRYKYYGMAPVKPEVSRLLRLHGIEHSVHESSMFQHISIPIDQEACPRPGRRKATTHG